MFYLFKIWFCFHNRCRICIKEVVPFLSVDVIDYRYKKNSNITDENDFHNNENFDLLTEHKEKGILLVLQQIETISIV